jgi:hypothetical protein
MRVMMSAEVSKYTSALVPPAKSCGARVATALYR